MKHKPLTKTQIKRINKDFAERNPQKRELVLVLQDVNDPINVGKIFRIAEGAGVSRLFLCGSTPKPPEGGISMTSRGTERVLNWEDANIKDLLPKLKQDNFQIVSLELTEESVNYAKADYKDKVALVLGNEAHGVYKYVLTASDLHIAIPMRGKIPSLNVAVATGIAVYGIV